MYIHSMHICISVYIFRYAYLHVTINYPPLPADTWTE